jgi:hypothetical protein
MIEDASQDSNHATGMGHAGWLLSRIGNRIKSHFSPETPPPPAEPETFADVDPMLRPYAGKVCTAEEAVGHVRHGDPVFVGTACATPRSLVEAMEGLPRRPADVERVHFITDIAAVKQGLAVAVPMSNARVPALRSWRSPAILGIHPPTSRRPPRWAIRIGSAPAWAPPCKRG